MESISAFGKILIHLVVGVLLMLGLFGINKWIAPRKSTVQKLSSYECGEENIGNAWLPMSSKFYTIAVIFLFFDVELAMILPWTTIFADKALIRADARWGWFNLIEMFVFIGLLVLGLLYVWKMGDLNWVIPHKVAPRVEKIVPEKLYEAINNKNYAVTPFQIAPPKEEIAEKINLGADKPISKPSFKPTFRKKEL